MPNYHVVLIESEKYGMEIEAEDGNKARKKGWDKLSKMTKDQRDECLFDSDRESTAEEISKMF